ncbi:archease [Paludisphaera rhizosphaerae]|uniref:archease n=1 Tax=Paludisphaera rhizosphaerae TaxID=2711216 RepID=UPI001F0FB9BC|nr:archease [Paludisphaera rhizosphaerae]
MGRVEVFDHTADLGLRIEADDLDDVFRTAAEGLFDVVTADRSTIEPREEEIVELGSDSPAHLLVDWLNELIFRIETRHALYGRFDVSVAPDGRSLTATIAGEPIDPDRHVLDHEVKAATYHGLVLEPAGDSWRAEVIVDI